MKKIISRISLIGLLYLNPLYIYAYDGSTPFNGIALLESCEITLEIWKGKLFVPGDQSFLVGLCSGYIMGVTHYDSVFVGVIKQVGGNIHAPVIFCLPDNTTHIQQAMVLVNYLKTNPGKLNKHALELVTAAFHETWPCKN